MAIHRPAVRIVCLDGLNRILLLCWRDPSDGHLVWESPGGGVEEGETPLETARRELAEETGLPGSAVLDHHVVVARDLRWNGTHYAGDEEFYLARFDHTPELTRAGLVDHEVTTLVEHRWVRWDELDALGTVEPPALLAVLGALVPAGPWA